MLNKGDEIKVRVVEVDRERGRIGLRLADDPDVAGKSVEELAGVGTGGGGGGDRGAAAATAATAARAAVARGRGGDRDGRGGDRDRPRRDRDPDAASARGRDRRVTEHRITELDSGVRVVTERMPSVRSVALGFWIGTGSRDERDAQAGLSHLLEHLLFRGTDALRLGGDRPDLRRDGRRAQRRHRQGERPRSTRACSTRTSRDAFDVMGDMVWRPRFGDVESEREVVLEEIAMYEDDPQDKVFDVLGEAVFGAHPLGRAVIGRAEVVAGTPVEQIARLPRRALRARATS